MTAYTGQAIKRQALPIERTVKWLPLDDAYYLLAEVMTSTRAAPLVVMQEALVQVERHASSEVYGSTCGVLCGGHYRDPKSNVIYLLVEGIERATRVERDADPYASLAIDLSSAIASAERAGRTVVGWYRFDVALSQRVPTVDIGIHRSLFSEPWQVALLRDGADGEGSGAFVRVEPTEGRAFRIPFLELIPRKQSRGRGPRRTSVQWRNYSAESTVALLPADAFRDAPSHRSAKPGATKPGAARPGAVERRAAETPHANGTRRAGLFSGILGRWSASSRPARPAATPMERPLFPHPPVQRPTVSEEPPSPVVESAPAPLESPPSPVERELSPVESLPPVESSPPIEIPPPPIESAPPPVTETPPLEASPPLDASPPLEALPPEAALPLPNERVEISLDRVAPDDAAEEPAPPFFDPAAPSDELEAVFAEWQPETGEHIVDKPFRDPWLPPALGIPAKRALAAAALLAIAYFGVQRVRAARETRSASAAGAVSTQQPQSKVIATEDGAGGEVATASAQRTEDDGFTPEQKVEVRSALASIAESHAALAAHLDTLNSALLAARGSAGRAAACAHASSLYQSSLDDQTRIDLAREKLAGLVGPMRMAGVDSLARRAAELHPLLQDVCQ